MTSITCTCGRTQQLMPHQPQSNMRVPVAPERGVSSPHLSPRRQAPIHGRRDFLNVSPPEQNWMNAVDCEQHFVPGSQFMYSMDPTAYHCAPIDDGFASFDDINLMYDPQLNPDLSMDLLLPQPSIDDITFSPSGVQQNPISRRTSVSAKSNASSQHSPSSSLSTDEEKPVCWNHGCNGKLFSSWSNLRRHERERNGETHHCYCPRCGAYFSRTTARNQHLSNGSCNRIRRYSNGRVRPSTLKLQK